MSNQTTLLSFIRIALCFLLAGLSLNGLLKLENSLVFQITFFIVSISILIIGVFNFFKQRKLIKSCENNIGDYKFRLFKKIKVDVNFWNTRYKEIGFAYGLEPNEFLRSKGQLNKT